MIFVGFEYSDTTPLLTRENGDHLFETITLEIELMLGKVCYAQQINLVQYYSKNCMTFVAFYCCNVSCS